VKIGAKALSGGSTERLIGAPQQVSPEVVGRPERRISRLGFRLRQPPSRWVTTRPPHLIAQIDYLRLTLERSGPHLSADVSTRRQSHVIFHLALAGRDFSGSRAAGT
jgi:hypothetical protein